MSSSEARKIRASAQWRKLSEQLRSQNVLCSDPFGIHAAAGTAALATAVHHKAEVSIAPHKAFALDNLICVCGLCHAALHRSRRAAVALEDILFAAFPELADAPVDHTTKGAAERTPDGQTSPAPSENARGLYTRPQGLGVCPSIATTPPEAMRGIEGAAAAALRRLRDHLSPAGGGRRRGKGIEKVQIFPLSTEPDPLKKIFERNGAGVLKIRNGVLC